MASSALYLFPTPVIRLMAFLARRCADSSFGAIDVPGHASDTSNEFRGPVCSF